MTDGAVYRPFRKGDGEAALWGWSSAVVLGLHGAIALGAVAWGGAEPPPAPPPAAALVLDLAPLQAAPTVTPTEIPPGPQLAEAVPPPPPEPEPEPEPEQAEVVLPPPPEPQPEPEPEQAEVVLPPPPEPQPEPERVDEPPPIETAAVALPPKPEVKPRRVTPPKPKAKPRREPPPKLVREMPPAPEPSSQPPAPATTALQAAPQKATVAAAPTVGEPSPSIADAVQTWQSALLGHLERHKRYPRAARWRRQEGVAYVRFSMDRDGHVLGSWLERSSGAAALDEETLKLIKRAEPLPKPPAEVAGETVQLVVPVQFLLR